jgi:hypothetical protein
LNEQELHKVTHFCAVASSAEFLAGESEREAPSAAHIFSRAPKPGKKRDVYRAVAVI